MPNLEKFIRYRDVPTLKEPGTSPVATSIEQLEKMSLEERQRVVASIEVLSKYSSKLKDEITKSVSQLSSADLDKIKSGLEESLTSRVDEVLKKIDQEDKSLDIKHIWFGIQSNVPEIRWEKPNWNKPYQVEVYLSKNDSTDLSTATLSSTVESPKDYHIFTDDVEGKYVFVRAKDKESGTYGEFSSILKIEDKDVRLAKFLEYVQGKIKATALDEKFLASLKESINSATDSKISSEIAKVSSAIESTKSQIQGTIDSVRNNSESAWSQLRDTVARNGTDISSIKKKSDGLAESIDTLTSKSNTALAGIENINTVIAEKDSAVRREIQNALTQVDSTRTELRRELSQSATAFESKLSEERDARTQVGNSLARATEKLDQVATESEALKKKTSSIETDVAGNKTKTLRLENNLSSLESSTIEQLDSIRSSFNNDHFYNHNMAGGESSWMTDNPNQDLSVSVNTGTSTEDLRYPNILSSIVNTGNIFVKSTEVRPIEKDKTYQLTATFRTTDTTANLKEAILYLLPFDKSGNNHTPDDGLLNDQGGSKYPIIQVKQEVRPNGWVTLTGEIHAWSSSYPISDPSEANLIPLPTVFGCPALELIGKTGAGSFKADIVILDLRDISSEKNVTALIDGYKKTQSDENKALAQQFSSQAASFKEGIDSRITTLSNSISEASRTANTKLEDITSKLGESSSKIQKLEQTVNDEKSSNALKIDTLRAEFQKSKANQINFDLDQTPTFEVQPVTKYRIIDTSAAFLIKREYVQKFPEKKYLKFWGRTLEFKNTNRLPVKSNDRLYSSANLFSTRANIQGFIRYTDENGNQIGALQSIGTVSSNTVTTLENSNLVVPENPAIKFAELRFDTGSNSLSETNGPILISNPQLRHYDETAIKSDSKLNDLKIAVSSELQSYSERTQGIEAELNGRLAQNNIKQTARAEADEVATSKVETAKSELQNSISNIETAQTTLSNKVKAQAEEIKTVKSGFDSEISKANSRIDSTNTTFNDKYSSLAGKTDTLESNYRSLEGKRTQSESKITTLENTQTTDRQAFTNFKRDAESKLNNSSSKISKLEKTTTDLNSSIANTSKSLKSEFTNNLNTAKTELSGKIDQNERTASDKYRTLSERTTTLESKANTVDGRISNAIISERTNTEATANRVAAEKSSELKVQFDARLSADQNNLLSFTDTLDWVVDKGSGETQSQTSGDGTITLRGVTTAYKQGYQLSREGDAARNTKASQSLTTVQPDLPYILTFEARSNIAGNVLNPILRLYYKDVNNANQWRNSNVPSIPLVDEWRTYQVTLTAPSLNANETRNYFACMFEMKSTGTIQVRNPRLVYDAKTAIERINASITETKQLAVDVSGKVRAKIGLKVNANGKAVGWSSEVNGDTNNFSINADNFKIANGADDYTPFSIDTANRKIRFNGEVAFTKGTNLLKNPIMSIATDIPSAEDSTISNLSAILNWGVQGSQYIEIRKPSSNWSPDVVYYPGELCINIRHDNRTPRPEGRTGWLYQDVSVTVGSWYMFSAWAASHGSRCRLVVEKINANGAFIEPIAQSNFVGPGGGGRDLNNYSRLFVKFKATTPNIRVALEQVNLNNQSSTSVLQSWLFRPMLEQCSENATGPSAWSNSASGTVIDGDHLSTSSVSLDKLSFSPSATNLFKNSQLMPINPDTQNASPYFWDFYDHANRSNDLVRGQEFFRNEWGGGVNGKVERIYTNNSNPNEFVGASWRHLIAQDVWLVPGTYIFSCYGANHGSNPLRLLGSDLFGSGSKLQVRFEKLNADREFIDQINFVNKGVIPAELGDGNFWNGPMHADRAWVKVEVTESTFYRIGLGVGSNSNSERSEIWFGRPMLEQVKPTQNSPSPFTHSVTKVDKDSLYVPNLSSLSANLGHVTAGSFNINNKAGINSDGHLWANGVNINGTITATGGSIKGILTVGDDWNNGVRIHGDGARCIVVVEGGHIKVRLGKL